MTRYLSIQISTYCPSPKPNTKFCMQEATGNRAKPIVKRQLKALRVEVIRCEQPGRVTRHRAARSGVDSREEDREKEEITKTPEKLEGNSKSNRKPQKLTISNEKAPQDKSQKKVQIPTQAKGVSRDKKKAVKQVKERSVSKKQAEVIEFNKVIVVNEVNKAGENATKEAYEEKEKVETTAAQNFCAKKNILESQPIEDKIPEIKGKVLPENEQMNAIFNQLLSHPTFPILESIKMKPPLKSLLTSLKRKLFKPYPPALFADHINDIFEAALTSPHAHSIAQLHQFHLHANLLLDHLPIPIPIPTAEPLASLNTSSRKSNQPYHCEKEEQMRARQARERRRMQERLPTVQVAAIGYNIQKLPSEELGLFWHRFFDCDSRKYSESNSLQIDLLSLSTPRLCDMEDYLREVLSRLGLPYQPLEEVSQIPTFVLEDN